MLICDPIYPNVNRRAKLIHNVQNAWCDSVLFREQIYFYCAVAKQSNSQVQFAIKCVAWVSPKIVGQLGIISIEHFNILFYPKHLSTHPTSCNWFCGTPFYRTLEQISGRWIDCFWSVLRLISAFIRKMTWSPPIYLNSVPNLEQPVHPLCDCNELPGSGQISLFIRCTKQLANNNLLHNLIGSSSLTHHRATKQLFPTCVARIRVPDPLEQIGNARGRRSYQNIHY